MEPVDIPSFLDNPPQFLFLEADDLMPLMLGFSGGVIGRYVSHSLMALVYGLLVGALLTHLYIKYKRNALTGVMYHFSYCIGAGPLNKRFKTGLIKRLDN